VTDRGNMDQAMNGRELLSVVSGSAGRLCKTFFEVTHPIELPANAPKRLVCVDPAGRS
jgi:hypothetical protein